MRTPLDCLQHWVQQCPDDVYLSQPQSDGQVKDYTWRDVDNQARRVAKHLRQLDLPPGSHIVLLGKNSAHWIMADLAIWMAGHVSVPMYATLNAESAAYVLEHCEAKLLFVGRMDELWADMAPAIPPTLPCITLPLAPQIDGTRWDDIVARTPPLQDLSKPAPQDVATLIYTSGSTGHPKGAMISFGAMMALRRISEVFEVSRNDRLLSYLPLAHTLERALVEIMSLMNGVQVHFAYSLDTFRDDLLRARPTVFVSVPRLWAKFYQGVCAQLPPSRQKWMFATPLLGGFLRKKILKQLGLDQVRVALTGSAPLAPALIDWYRGLGLELLEGYGMTENFAYSHTSLAGRSRVGYVGHANPGVVQRINPHNSEIEVKSPAMMLGYYKAPELTQEVFTADGFLKTGDMGELDEQSRLKITGRIKELFKTSKGKYVAPQPIEKYLADHPAVGMVCVTGVGLPQPLAIVSLADEVQAQLDAGEVSVHRLKEELEQLLITVNAALDAHEKLDYIVIAPNAWNMQNGLLTPTMKIRRPQIEARYTPHFDTWAARREPVVWAATHTTSRTAQ